MPAFRSHRVSRATALLVTVGILAGCAGGGSAAPSAEPSADPTRDKLAHVLARGTLVLSTDLEYPPQSYRVDGAARAADTRCLQDQLTALEVAGYDADTGKAVATALGVEPCFVVPPWTEITAGNWGDRWDISYGSGSINADRMARLWMTQPYYAVPNHYFVRADSTYRTPADLDGMEIGACASCSHEFYLNGELEIPGAEVVLSVEDPVVVTYQTEATGLEALAAGDLDAFLCAEPVGAQAIADGLALRSLDEPAFTYYPSGFVDKSSGLEARAFVERVNDIVRGLHADGTLEALSVQYFGVDYAAAAADFDLDAIGQVLE